MPEILMPLYGDDKYQVLRDMEKRFMQWPIEAERPAAKLPVEELDTEFKREFPPDPFGHEADDGARVWKVYRAQATAHDDTLLDGWNGALDILLIFSGLFSAVVTAFLIESYQSLQFDKDGFVVNALYTLVELHSANGRPIALPLPPPIESPSPTTRWINGLWFTSLMLALGVSLLAIVVKQWLREYKARNTASTTSPRQWAHRRQFLYDALVSWRIADLISVLPLLLHAALFLFLAGSVLFLWDLDRSIAWVIVSLSVFLGAGYVASVGIPLWLPQCPSSTPLVNVMRRSYISTLIALTRTSSRLLRLLKRSYEHFVESEMRCWRRWKNSQLQVRCRRVQRAVLGWRSSLSSFYYSRIAAMQTSADVPTSFLPRWRVCFRITRPLPLRAPSSGTVATVGDHHDFTSPLRVCLHGFFSASCNASKRVLIRILHGVVHAVLQSPSIDTLEQRLTNELVIRRHVKSACDDLDASSLLWLITVVSDSDAVAVALQAIGGLRPSSHAAAILSLSGAVRREVFPSATTGPSGNTSALEVARLVKSLLLKDAHLGYGFISRLSDVVVSDMYNLWLAAASDGPAAYPDFELLLHSLVARPSWPPTDNPLQGLPGFTEYSTATATATIMVLLRCYGDKGLRLLEYCDFLSPAMDWNVVLYAAGSDVSDERWSTVPESPRREAACACLALAATLWDTETDGSPVANPKYPYLPKTLVRIMDFSLNPPHSSYFTYAAEIYGTHLSHLINFIKSPLFPIGDSDGVFASLMVLYSAWQWNQMTEVDSQATGRHISQMAMSLLLRAAKADARIMRSFAEVVRWFIVYPNFPACDVPYMADSLSLFLLPNDSWPNTTIYKELWTQVESTHFIWALRAINSSLSYARESPIYMELEDCFYAEMRFVELLRFFGSNRHSGREGRTRFALFFHISKDYRTLRPSVWHDTVTAVIADTQTDEWLRELALELKEGSQTGDVDSGGVSS